jgi:Cu+-exporting ATPase
MAEISTEKQEKCYHCGDSCTGHTLRLGEKNFCCEGCLTVYQLLDQNGMCAYYDLEKNPGIKIKSKSQEKFAYLDEESIAAQLLDFNEGGTARIRFFIPKIHCTSCVWLLENLHKLKSGVLSSRVDFIRRELSVAYRKEEVSLRALVELLDSFGYTPEINLEQYNKREEAKEDKSIFYKIGIAGFCSGNIMLLSFPEYFGLHEIADSSFRYLFGYLNLLLALPVILYSGQDFFISAYNGIKNKVLNLDVPIAMGITAITLRSIYEVVWQVGPGYFDSSTGLIFFMLIGKWYQKKTYRSFSFERDYQSYFPVSVVVLTEKGEKPVPVKDIKKGDTILIRSEEIIPADATLLSTQASINYSFVTGESTPVAKQEGELIYAGGRQVGNAVLLRVEKEVSQSYLLQLWNKEVFKKENNAYLSSFVLKFSRYFTYGTILIALATFAYWYWYDPSKVLYAVTSVLLVACPCALALSLPFALGNSLSKLGAKGLYLKNADTIEKISTIDTLVFDKTGTLTQADTSSVEFVGQELNQNILTYVKSVTGQSTHPLSRMIYKHIKAETLHVESFTEELSKGVRCVISTNEIKIGSASWVGLQEDNPTNESRVYLAINGCVKGYFLFKNQYREGVLEMLRQTGNDYEVHLLSGDQDSEKAYLSGFMAREENIHFKQNPADKLEYIESLKRKGKHILMLGDGLNDAGALKAADVGVAVSEDVYSFSPACDGILEGRKLKDIAAFIRFSKTSVRTIQYSLVLSLLYNAVGLFFAVQGLLTPLIAAILMPMSSVTVVLFVVLKTNISAKKILKKIID